MAQLGKAVMEINELFDAAIAPSSYGPIIIGMLVAAISGIFAIKAMIAIVSKYSLKYFSVYVWLVAIFLIIYNFLN